MFLRDAPARRRGDQPAIAVTWRALVGAVASLALIATTLIGAQAAAAQPPPATAPGVTSVDLAELVGRNATCTQARKGTRSFAVDTSRVFSDGMVRIGNWTVDFRETQWAATHPRVALLTQAFHTSSWMLPERAEDITRSIRLFIEQATQNPDPGGQLTRERLRHLGWNESHVTWRMKVGLCLYRLGSDDQKRELLPALNQLIDANMDPNRYYGPPRFRAHNHGLMADRELLNAASLLGRPELAAVAVERLLRQHAQMYDACGLNYEQATSYQFLHVSLWRQLLRRIDNPQLARLIDNVISRQFEAAHGLAFPDGSVPAIGDGTPRTAENHNLVRRNLTLMCPDTGWFSRRDIASPIRQQIIARFGPATTMHGHADKGSFVWWVGTEAAGVPVIVDRGMPSKARPRQVDIARSAPSHAVFAWRDLPNARTAATHQRLRNGHESFTIRGARDAWTRTLSYRRGSSVMTVQDSLTASSPAGPAVSYFPLDPMWKSTSRPGQFVTDSGWGLRIGCRTERGRQIGVRSSHVDDFQITKPRRAITVSCRVSDARDGVTARIVVTPPSSQD